MGKDLVGLIGLGNIGRALAEHLCQAEFNLIVYDVAGTAEKAPSSAQIAHDLEEVSEAKRVLLSLPNGDISKLVCSQIAAVTDKKTKMIIDLSTIGPKAAQDCARMLEPYEIVYVDSPISGSRQGAVEGTLTLMVATEQEILKTIQPLLKTFSRNIFHLGERVGQGQAMKLINNFLASSVLTATSEALVAGLKEGLNLEQMIAVINVSTGSNYFTNNVFPEQIVSEKYALGFAASLLNKDIGLYAEHIDRQLTPHKFADLLVSIWRDFVQQFPEADTSEIFRYMQE